MICGFLGLNWCVSFLFCLLIHFLKPDLSCLLTFSLRQNINSVRNTHQSSRKRDGSKRGNTCISFTREYKLLFSKRKPGGATVARAAMEQITYFFRGNLTCDSSVQACLTNLIEIMTWVNGIFINSLLQLNVFNDPL